METCYDINLIRTELAISMTVFTVESNIFSFEECRIPEGITSVVCIGKGLRSLRGLPDSVRILDCRNNQLRSLKYCPSLEILYCSRNRLKSLKHCPLTLKELYCANNQLQTLEFCAPSLELLYCSENRLENLRFCPPSLRELHCPRNRLETLEFSPPLLRGLYCRGNRLGSLEFTPPLLKKLICDDNPCYLEYRRLGLEGIHKMNRLREGVWEIWNGVSDLKFIEYLQWLPEEVLMDIMAMVN